MKSHCLGSGVMSMGVIRTFGLQITGDRFYLNNW